MGVKLKTQSIGEYVILVSVLTAAVISMQTYIKRSIQSVVKYQADQMSEGKQYSIEFNPKKSFSLGSQTTTESNENKTIEENATAHMIDSESKVSIEATSSSWQGEIEHED